MRRRHDHGWMIAGQTYAPPAPLDLKAFEEDDPPVSLVRESMFGLTVITLTCTQCGDFKHISTAGDGRAMDPEQLNAAFKEAAENLRQIQASQSS